MRSASSASMMRPVSISSQAREAPIRRGSSQLTPMSQPERPRRTKATLKRADGGGDPDVARQGQGEAAPCRRTVHGGDHRLGQRAQPGDQRGDVGLGGEGRSHPVEALGSRRSAVPAEIEPGAEAPPGAGEDDDPAGPVHRDVRRARSWSSAISSAFMAFNRSGRSRVIRVTPSWGWSTCSVSMMGSLRSARPYPATHGMAAQPAGGVPGREQNMGLQLHERRRGSGGRGLCLARAAGSAPRLLPPWQPIKVGAGVALPGRRAGRPASAGRRALGGAALG